MGHVISVASAIIAKIIHQPDTVRTIRPHLFCNDSDVPAAMRPFVVRVLGI